MRVFSFISSSAAAFFLTIAVVHGQGGWTIRPVLDSSGAAGLEMDTAVSAGGDQWVIHTKDISEVGNPRREVRVGMTTNSGATSSINLGLVSLLSVPLDDCRVRIASGGGATWVAWREQITAGRILVRCIAPEHFVGSTLVLPSAGTVGSKFDLAVGSDGQPRVALIENDRTIVRLSRRSQAGEWQAVLMPRGPFLDLFHDVSIHLHGDVFHLFTSEYQSLTEDGTGDTLLASQVNHFAAQETEDWTDFTLGASAVVDSRLIGTNSANKKVAERLRGTCLSDGRPAAIYTDQSAGLARLAVRGINGIWTSQVLPTVGGLGPTGHSVDLAADNFGRLHLVWQTLDNSALRYGLRKADGMIAAEALAGIGREVAVTCGSAGGARIVGYNDLQQIRIAWPTDDADDDANGFTVIEELAFDLAVSKNFAPKFEIHNHNGQPHGFFIYRRKNTGAPQGQLPSSNPFVAGGFRYTVESSTDLKNWSTSAGFVHHAFFNVAPAISEYRTSLPIADDGIRFFRVRVERE